MKIAKFYEDLFSLQSVKCSVCQEQFPFITVNADNVCTQCHRDKHVPKLYCGDKAIISIFPVTARTILTSHIKLVMSTDNYT